MYVVVIYHVQDLKSCPQAATSSRALRPIFFACFAIAHGAWVTVFLEMAEATGGAGAAQSHSAQNSSSENRYASRLGALHSQLLRSPNGLSLMYISPFF